MISVGFYGKIPVRGDFVQAGLPRPFVLAWDAWMQRVLQASRIALGEAWLPAWMEAPVWRFRLPGHVCGPDPVLGLWMPSVDQAGRHFPLVFAAVWSGPATARGEGTDWLDGVEEIGLDALEDDLTPDVIAARLRDLPAPAELSPLEAPDLTRWWTEGGPGVAACTQQYTGMPGPAEFPSLLLDAAPPAEYP